ncbi:uncharacterized protein T551_02415 [Pneumocystis jirovecii RU7]|uniref:Uncharacterized protein n=1 Tax=Pneumocystis jirovecii (strain RU7) TaxID=1408657 RepID=A0A0W4ZL87_PNEJ7|nr:uncharacterized protein T551_02415 [Pneumocystis jirovecii RU7]KTW29141.1 hypothetical protein T551_02415 [Pneumocystis jirovecii RU7]
MYHIIEKEILETRLSRIENIVYGVNNMASSKDISLDILSLINFIEVEINKLVKGSEVLRKMLYLFDTFLLEEKFFSFKSYDVILQSEKNRVVFSNTPLYSTVTSQMLSIRELSIPDSDIYFQVAANIYQLHIMFISIESVEKQLNFLSRRIAKVLELWYEVGIDTVNDCFLEWDERIDNLNSKMQKCCTFNM